MAGPIPRKRPLLSLGALFIALLAAVLAAFAWIELRGGAANPANTFAEADARASAVGNDVAATVNGVGIPVARVEWMRAMLQVFPAQGLDAADTNSIVEFLVGQELLRQEAERRGLAPSDAEITTAILEQQKGLQQLLASGTAPSDITNIIRGLEKTGHPLNEWHTDPAMRAAVAATLAQGMLARDEARDVPQHAPNRGEILAQRLAGLEARLRATADVRIIIP
jgi:hypothetical protein